MQTRKDVVTTIENTQQALEKAEALIRVMWSFHENRPNLPLSENDYKLVFVLLFDIVSKERNELCKILDDM